MAPQSSDLRVGRVEARDLGPRGARESAGGGTDVGSRELGPLVGTRELGPDVAA